MTREVPLNVQRRVQGLVFVTVFLDMVGFGIVFPLLPFYVQSMGGSAFTVGVLLGCFSVTQLAATPFLGRFSDLRGRRPVILLSLFANATAMGLFALASYERMLVLLFASRILAGATSGNLAACQAAVADSTPPSARARAMGLIGAGIGLGIVLGPLLGGLVAGWGAWLPPLAAGVLALLGALGVLFGMPETHPPEERAARASPGRFAAIAQVPQKRALAIVLGLYFLVFFAMTNNQVALALLAKARFDWDAKQVGYAFALFGLIGLVIQGGIIGPVSKALGEVPVLVTGALTFACGLLGVSFASRPLALVGAVAVMSTGLGLVQPIMSSLASQVAGNHQGAILGLAQSAGGLARTVGPLASGAIYASFGPGVPFGCGAVAAAMAAVLGLSLAREGIGQGRRKAPAAVEPRASASPDAK